ncbi:DUF732 domain-containing protein [Nocardia sp. BMG51109]|uniref:DUF732 domain-containing protein n=1 Tax=Nocardia sp. BMG51109 TaxID=1056816 RepID=UPI000463B24E|nr:DUF732 domain-containing protein [Nocardia sp. BMG51109]
MLRTRGKVTGVVVSMAAAVGLLAACGDNDSTASSTPTLKTSATSAAPGPTIPSVVQIPPEESSEPAPTTEEAPERPAPVQPTPENASGQLSAKDQALIEQLKQRGLNPTPDIAVTTAGFVCQSKQSGLPADQVTTYVNAMAGSDPAFDPNKMPVEQAGRIYVDVANQGYCNQ